MLYFLECHMDIGFAACPFGMSLIELSLPGTELFYNPWRSSQRSASSAAWQPEAALVMAWR